MSYSSAATRSTRFLKRISGILFDGSSRKVNEKERKGGEARGAGDQMHSLVLFPVFVAHP